MWRTKCTHFHDYILCRDWKKTGGWCLMGRCWDLKRRRRRSQRGMDSGYLKCGPQMSSTDTVQVHYLLKGHPLQCDCHSRASSSSLGTIGHAELNLLLPHQQAQGAHIRLVDAWVPCSFLPHLPCDLGQVLSPLWALVCFSSVKCPDQLFSILTALCYPLGSF